MEFCPSVHCIHSAFQYVPSQQFWFPAKNDRYLSIFPNSFPRTSLSTLLPTQITGSDSSSLFPGFVSSKLQKKNRIDKTSVLFLYSRFKVCFLWCCKKAEIAKHSSECFSRFKMAKVMLSYNTLTLLLADYHFVTQDVCFAT